MNNYYICTLGTSIANVLGDVLRQKQKVSEPWAVLDSQFEQALDEVVAKALSVKESFFTRSAETTVLHKDGISKDDRVALFATDTYLGRVCGEATVRLIVSGFGLKPENVELVRVPGLQVSNAELLRTTGLNEFVKAAVSRIENCRYMHQVKLCPVGGYKGIVPFLTALGMVYRLPVLYTFEHINSLVRLPPLPFSIDRELYSRAKRAFAELGRRCEMPEQEFLSRIDGYVDDERDFFLSLVEPSGRSGYVTTTCFTETFAPDFERDTAPVSSAALRDLEVLSRGQLYRAACKMVIGSQDKLIRSQWVHPKTIATDLDILKQGNTSVRVLGYLQSGRFYVCRVLAHSEYDKLLDAHALKKADFPIDGFTEWSMPEETIPESLKDEESPFESAMRRFVVFEEKLAEVQRQCSARIVKEKEARLQAEKRVASLEQSGMQLRKNNADAKKQMEALRSKLVEGEARVAAAEQSKLEQELSHKNAEEAQFAKYSEALEEIKGLKQKLREARVKLSMAPQNAEIMDNAVRELERQKRQFAEALQNLMMSDHSSLSNASSDEVCELRRELKKANARIASMAEAERLYEQDYSRLADALREANVKLAEATRPRSFWKRVAACFKLCENPRISDGVHGL